MHTCSSKEEKLLFGTWFEREPQAVPRAFWTRLELSAAINASLRVAPAWLCVTMVPATRRLRVPEKALGPSPAVVSSGPWGTPGRSCGPHAQPLASARCQLALPAGGKVVVAQQSPSWRRQVRGRYLQVEKSNCVALWPCLSSPLLFYRHLTRTTWYQTTGPTSTRCSKPMCTQQPIILVHWINMITGLRPPLEGPLPTADDGQILLDWITSYMIFF